MMPDITMCVNTKCPIREFCYRYRAKPDERQSFAMFEFTPKGSYLTQCAEFWGLQEEKRPVLSLDDADKNNQTTESQIKKIKKDVK